MLDVADEDLAGNVTTARIGIATEHAGVGRVRVRCDLDMRGRRRRVKAVYSLLYALYCAQRGDTRLGGVQEVCDGRRRKRWRREGEGEQSETKLLWCGGARDSESHANLRQESSGYELELTN